MELIEERSAACKKEMGDDDQFCKGHKKQHGVKSAEKKAVETDDKKKSENDTDKVVKTKTQTVADPAVAVAEAKAKETCDECD